MNIEVKEKSKLLEYLVNNKIKSRKDLKAYLKYGNIYVNGKVSTKFDRELREGDKIEIRETKDKDFDIDIIYEDKDIIVVNKPSGLLSISTETETSYTMYKIVSNYLKNVNKNNRVFVVHRLDKDTSGIMVFAKNEIIKEYLQNYWDKISIRKYVAVVEGITKEHEIIESFLEESDIYVYSSKTGKKAITEYNKMRNSDKYSLLDITIHTGKKNQIRVHMKDINHPIVGDRKYGAKDFSLKRLALHAYYLSIDIEGKKLFFETKIPNNFLKLVKK